MGPSSFLSSFSGDVVLSGLVTLSVGAWRVQEGGEEAKWMRGAVFAMKRKKNGIAVLCGNGFLS